VASSDPPQKIEPIAPSTSQVSILTAKHLTPTPLPHKDGYTYTFLYDPNTESDPRLSASQGAGSKKRRRHPPDKFLIDPKNKPSADQPQLATPVRR